MNDPAQGQIVFVVISFLSSIAVIASVIIGVIKLNRRIPPLAEDVAKNYATRTELDDEIRDVNVRIDREITMILASNAEQAKKLDSLITTTSHTARETDRAIGRIEGMIEGIKAAIKEMLKDRQ